MKLIDARPLFRLTLLSAVCLLCLGACSKSPFGGEFEKGDRVDLRGLPPLGFKWTDRQTGTVNLADGSGGWKDYVTGRYEVIAASVDTVTVKCTKETTTHYWGSVYQNPAAENAQTRLTITKIDRCRRVLSSEGQSRDERSESPWPDRPVRLGKSFTTKVEGSGRNAGATVPLTYTLREVIRLHGRRVAVLDVTFGGRMMGSSGSVWVDLQTGIQIKYSINLTGVNLYGLRVKGENIRSITSANGEDWLD